VIPAEAVEAAAKAIVLTVVGRSWESLLPSRQEWHREQARAALEAAAPYMRETVTEWAAAFPVVGNAYNYHRTREEAQAFVDAMQEDGVRMIVMTREVLPAEASDWKPAP